MSISGIPLRTCHRCKRSIWRKMFYKEIAKGKVICDKCHRPKQIKTFLIRLLEELR